MLLALAALLLAGCAAPAPEPVTTAPAALTWEHLEVESTLPVSYATQFSVERLAGGYQRITIDQERYLVVPEGAEVPAGVPEEVTVLRQPLDCIYLVATSAMDLFRELEAIDAVRLSGVQESGWYIQEARQAMAEGRLLYAGKYSAPDYERILSQGCDLAVESTMIYHTPEVKEQLERLGIPVLVERSSYESHPLGRMEWIKLYGALLGKDDEAAAYYDAVLDRLAPILERENTGKTVAFFYITSNGMVNVRKSGDYIAKCIELAGGRYVFSDLGDGENALSTMTIQMEAFYQQARDADILIYNSAIDGGLTTTQQLLDKSGVLADFKAVRSGDVYCTDQDLFQHSLGLGELMEDIHAVVSAGEDPRLQYLHRLS